MALELIRSLFQQASAQGSRSTALNPIGWAFATILAALIASVTAHSPVWVTAVLAVFAGLILVVYLFGFLYLMIKDRDALRSERFTLSKMAIERSVIGDSLKGFAAAPDDIRKLPSVIQPIPTEPQEPS